MRDNQMHGRVESLGLKVVNDKNEQFTGLLPLPHIFNGGNGVDKEIKGIIG